MGEGRSLAETPTWSVATVTTAMIFVCFLVERSIHRLGKWLAKTKRKAMLASLEKIREELMLLGLISLMLSQTARWISEVCVPSSLFTSRFYICSENDFSIEGELGGGESHPLNDTDFASTVLGFQPHGCDEGYEPFVSFQGLEQLHIFLFILGITHVLYSFVTVVLSMIKIYSWRTWEKQAYPMSPEDLQARRNKMMRKQSSFVFHHASHPWSKSKSLIWMLCFMRQFKGSMAKSDYMALRLGFITSLIIRLSFLHVAMGTKHFWTSSYITTAQESQTAGFLQFPQVYGSKHGRRVPWKYWNQVTAGIRGQSAQDSWPLWVYAILCIFVNIHGLNIYFWLSFVPAILIMLVGTKLQHVVAQLALEVVEATDPFVGSQLKPRDDLFWFGKPEILLWLIQFISFQNAFEMATFIWSLCELDAHSCFMKNNFMVSIRLVSGVLVQIWCSYSTLPLNVIITQMGSKFKKTLIAESVRESLHSWCKRVKTRRSPLLSRVGTTTSICSLDMTLDDETITVGTLSRSPSMDDLPEVSLDEQIKYSISHL